MPQCTQAVFENDTITFKKPLTFTTKDEKDRLTHGKFDEKKNVRVAQQKARFN